MWPKTQRTRVTIGVSFLFIPSCASGKVPLRTPSALSVSSVTNCLWEGCYAIPVQACQARIAAAPHCISPLVLVQVHALRPHTQAGISPAIAPGLLLAFRLAQGVAAVRIHLLPSRKHGVAQKWGRQWPRAHCVLANNGRRITPCCKGDIMGNGQAQTLRDPDIEVLEGHLIARDAHVTLSGCDEHCLSLHQSWKLRKLRKLQLQRASPQPDQFQVPLDFQGPELLCSGCMLSTKVWVWQEVHRSEGKPFVQYVSLSPCPQPRVLLAWRKSESCMQGSPRRQLKEGWPEAVKVNRLQVLHAGQADIDRVLRVGLDPVKSAACAAKATNEADV